jgi:hypothetical protein
MGLDRLPAWLLRRGFNKMRENLADPRRAESRSADARRNECDFLNGIGLWIAANRSMSVKPLKSDY